MTDEQKSAQSARMKARWAAQKLPPKQPVEALHPAPPPKVKAKVKTGDPVKVPEKPAGGERRLYQSRPEKKEWLTKAEAEERGHVWVDDPKKAGVDKTLVRGVREE